MKKIIDNDNCITTTETQQVVFKYIKPVLVKYDPIVFPITEQMILASAANNNQGELSGIEFNRVYLTLLRDRECFYLLNKVHLLALRKARDKNTDWTADDFQFEQTKNIQTN